MNPPAVHSILHVMRSPVGGLFRHVVDLAREQTARGHRVGIIADASTGGDRARDVLSALNGEIALGVTRIAMARDLGPSDVSAGRHVAQRLAATGATIVHGHGSKGGAYARLVGGKRLKVYTPHGGSLHYSRSTPVGFAYLTLEGLLAARTDLFLFESRYGETTFAAKVCRPKGLVRVVHNGVSEAEFAPVAPEAEAADLLFVGELRHLKGVDTLIEAMALLAARGQAMTATVVGGGPDAEAFKALARDKGLADRIAFPGPLPARQAFGLGRLMVVPSRAESLPYIVLEAGAAGLPLIATGVGGIGEIFGEASDRLIPADSPSRLAEAIAERLAAPDRAAAEAAALRSRIHAQFSVAAMTDGVLAAYDAALAFRA